MSNIFSKLKDFVGMNESVDYEYDYEEVDGEEYRNLYQEEVRSALKERQQAKVNRINLTLVRTPALRSTSSIRVPHRTSHSTAQVEPTSHLKETLVSNVVVRRRSLLLPSTISTLLLLGITLLSSNYLSRTDRDFGTKIRVRVTFLREKLG